MGDVPPQDSDGVGHITKTFHLMVLRGRFPSLPTKKMTRSNLVVVVVSLVAWGL